MLSILQMVPDTMRMLVRQYVRMRAYDGNAVTKSAWRITVRQLESMIRLAEAMARLHCKDKVTVRHVAEAARLIDKSIIRVEQPDVDIDETEAEARETEMMEALEAAGTIWEMLQKTSIFSKFSFFIFF